MFPTGTSSQGPVKLYVALHPMLLLSAAGDVVGGSGSRAIGTGVGASTGAVAGAASAGSGVLGEGCGPEQDV